MCVVGILCLVFEDFQWCLPCRCYSTKVMINFCFISHNQLKSETCVRACKRVCVRACVGSLRGKSCHVNSTNPRMVRVTTCSTVNYESGYMCTCLWACISLSNGCYIKFLFLIFTRYLEYSLDSSKVRSQDAGSVISYVASNPVGKYLAWMFVQNNWKALFDM